MLIEPIALSLANTHSSPERDRIATREQWQTWLHSWPGLRHTGRQIDSSGLAHLRVLRDDVQSVLRAAARDEKPDAAAAARIDRHARARPSYTLRWERGAASVVATDRHDAARVLAHHLARSTVDLLLSPSACALRECEGDNCLKMFLSTRANKRWCDSTICGNRARVRTYDVRHRRQR